MVTDGLLQLRVTTERWRTAAVNPILLTSTGGSKREPIPVDASFVVYCQQGGKVDKKASHRDNQGEHDVESVPWWEESVPARRIVHRTVLGNLHHVVSQNRHKGLIYSDSHRRIQEWL